MPMYCQQNKENYRTEEKKRNHTYTIQGQYSIKEE